MFFEPLKNIARNSIKLDANKVFATTISKNGINTFIADLNRNQLIQGLGSDDRSLMKYVDDPFFKSEAHALAYQRWKENISPDKGKSVEVVDFYINGYFHRSIYTEINEETFTLKSDVDFASDINNKEPDAFGLNTDSKNKLIELVIPFLIEEIRKNLHE